MNPTNLRGNRARVRRYRATHRRIDYVPSPDVPCLILMQGCGRTVSPGERGLHWRPYTVGLDKDPLSAGFHFKAPWNKVFVYNVKWQSFTEKVDALSADDLTVSVQAALTLRPLAEEVYLLAEEVGPNWYKEIVRPQFLAAVRNVVANYPMVVIPERSTEIGNKIEAVMVESLKGRHWMCIVSPLPKSSFQTRS